MMPALYPILEFDPNPEAILNPRHNTGEPDLPERGVLCFFADVLRKLVEDGTLVKIGTLYSEIGPNQIYGMEWEGQRLFVFHPGVGAPLSAAFLEETIALGGRKFIACGGCGVLNQEIMAGHALVLRSAVRAEGTSYHYLPPAREAEASPQAVSVLRAVLERHGVPYLTGKAWTTDGIYRETEALRAQRLAEGCQVVEMEAAAFFAVAQFRGVTFGQVVYGGDLVVPEGWDKRDWMNRADVRQMLFWLAVEAAAEL
ncbi:MAG TPA: nucleoside phosphorylase [Anaerolineaceae bacterium]